MVKSCSVGWGAKVAAVFAALYTSILGLAVLIPHANSAIEVFSAVMAAGLGILIALLAVPFISEITDKTETLEVEVIGEVVVEDSLSFGGANAGLKSERIFVADKGLVIDGYLFEWQKIKFEIEKDEIILRLPSGRRLPIPYSEELAEMLRKSKTSYFIDTK